MKLFNAYLKQGAGNFATRRPFGHMSEPQVFLIGYPDVSSPDKKKTHSFNVFAADLMNEILNTATPDLSVERSLRRAVNVASEVNTWNFKMSPMEHRFAVGLPANFPGSSFDLGTLREWATAAVKNGNLKMLVYPSLMRDGRGEVFETLKSHIGEVESADESSLVLRTRAGLKSFLYSKTQCVNEFSDEDAYGSMRYLRLEFSPHKRGTWVQWQILESGSPKTLAAPETPEQEATTRAELRVYSFGQAEAVQIEPTTASNGASSAKVAPTKAAPEDDIEIDESPTESIPEAKIDAPPVEAFGGPLSWVELLSLTGEVLYCEQRKPGASESSQEVLLRLVGLERTGVTGKLVLTGEGGVSYQGLWAETRVYRVSSGS